MSGMNPDTWPASTGGNGSERSLAASEEPYRILFDQHPHPMWVFDQETLGFLAVNEAAVRHYGYSREEFLSMDIRKIRPDLDLEKLEAYRERIHRNGSECSGDTAGHWQHRRKDGSIIWVEISWTQISFQGRTAVLALAHDITEWKKAEENLRRSEAQLRQAQKMESVGQLAGGVAHDFNNILTIIHGHAALLLASAKLDEEQTESARQVVLAAERASNLTRQLLTFSRRQPLQPKDLDLNEVVGSMSKMLRRILGEDILLQVRYSSALPLIRADISMMEQILLNLAVNARDAMPKGGKLTIETEAVQVGQTEVSPYSEAVPGSFVRMKVSDTGCGIGPEDLPRIFEPFFTTKDVGKGTGLGLATVYGIVKQHQGWIQVQSQLGHGTIFQVFLPCLPEAKADEVKKTKQQIIRGGSETILVVEDEAMVRKLVVRLLETYGYQVLEADNGPAALKLWDQEKSRIELLLTDIVMPDGMSGRDLADRFGREKPDLKVLFTSGYSTEVVGQGFILREGINFLQKPFEPRKLAQTVRECLDQHF